MINLKPSNFFEISHFSHSDLFTNCDYVWDALKRISSYLASFNNYKIETEIPQGVFLEKPELISIGKGTVVEPGAFIRGPCIIGENCSIRHGAYIRGDFIAGDRCVIGHASEVKSSIFFNHTQAAHFAYVGDSILGNHVNLGAGTKCANLKLDHQEIRLFVEGKLISTGLRKFGAIIGDGSQLGCNSVTNPGSLIGKEVLCYPCLNISGRIESNSIIKSSEKLVTKKRTK